MEEKITALVARDECGDLFLYIGCVPYKSELYGVWMFKYVQNSYMIQIESESYHQVKWEDKEPTKVELIIKVCE